MHILTDIGAAVWRNKWEKSNQKMGIELKLWKGSEAGGRGMALTGL